MGKRRVVVTGMGLVSPVGLTVRESWDSILAGRSGIGPVDTFDISGYPTRFGGPIRDFNVADYMNPKDARKYDAFVHYGVAAAGQAVQDSGLDLEAEDLTRIGVSIGSGIGGIGTIEETCEKFYANDYNTKKVSPFFIPSSIINMVSGQVSVQFGLQGPNVATVTACTTGTHNIGNAGRMIAYGDADVIVAGGTEMACNPIGMAGFCAARALSTRNDDPEAASRPWDADRDGFVLSDGAGVLVMEEYERAKARGATIYAELVGFGMIGDAYHITLPAEGGGGAVRCMNAALKDAGLNPDAIGYVNAHGTSTRAGDVEETRAVRAVFGDHADSLPVSSTKSMTGHMLGAAGAAEAVFTLLALRDQVLPPTINLDNPGEGCDLDYVPGEARDHAMTAALSNSFGFGGTNGTLVFRTL